MAKRIVRTGLQLGSVGLVLVLVIFFLDSRYRVLPSELHNLSPGHHNKHVVVDITVQTCSSLNVFQSCSLGTEWQRIQKDLYLNKGWVNKGYVNIQRKKEEDLTDSDSVVMDVKVGRLNPSGGGEHDDKWESRPGGLWLLRSAKRKDSDSSKSVTDVDVLFGADAVEPRPGWEIKDQALDVDLSLHVPEPRLTIRRGKPKEPDRIQPRVRKGGKFKIAQLSDVHLATGFGVCRDEYPQTGRCDADPRTISFLEELLDHEQPDLAVLSGDVVNGETAPDSQTALFKAAHLLIKRNIPWTIIFGNHDDEGSLSREGLLDLAKTLPLCLAERGPSTVDGVGNYVVEVGARGSSSHSAISLYHLDTHAYSPDERHYPGYDWLKPSQLAWFREEADTRRKSSAHKEYPRQRMDMAFIHIPLPEVTNVTAVVPGSGIYKEGATSPHLNTGFKDALVENGVMAVGFGHDHVNDFCSVHGHSDPAGLAANGIQNADGKLIQASEFVKKMANRGHVWLCYAGGAGYGGYGGYGGYERRVRMWEFDMEQARLVTWKIIDGHEGQQDLKTVVEGGRVLQA